MPFAAGLAGAAGAVGKVVGIAGTVASIGASASAAKAQQEAFEFNRMVERQNILNQRHTQQMDFLLRNHEMQIQTRSIEADLAFAEHQRLTAELDAELQQQVLNENARRDYIEAEQARLRTEEQIRRERERLEDVLAVQRARGGAQGVTGGPVEVLGENSTENILLSLFDLNYAGNLERQGSIESARINEWQSRLVGERNRRDSQTAQFQNTLNNQLANMRIKLTGYANEARRRANERQTSLALWANERAPNPYANAGSGVIGEALSGFSDIIGSFSGSGQNRNSYEPTYFNGRIAGA